MRIVGLTGGIASGKSTVSNLFKSHGIPVVDADLVARDVLKKGTGGWKKVVAAFGGDILQENEEVDRPKLGCIVFSDPDKRQLLNRAIAPGVLDIDVFGFQTLQHVMRMTRTWDSTMSMKPKGGDTIWGGLDWSPEEGYKCFAKKAKNNETETVGQNGKGCLDNRKHVHYGRMISFGKDVAEAQPTEIERMDFKSAHEQGTLVHLSNLDPEYTSGEVEKMLSSDSAVIAETGDSWFNC